VPSAQILEAIDKVYPLIGENAYGGVEPATTYRFADGEPGAIGVIASVTEPFCEACNRLRLTADGQLRSCLFAMYETDLRLPMRAGATDEELEELIRANVWAKWEGHKINHPDFERPTRSMSMIGG
jgi:cyclic pyranopterin phosphate synthase